MNNSFFVQGPKYVGDNFIFAVQDICVKGKEVVVKAWGKPESGKINAKNCCDMVTQAKIVGIFIKFIALAFAVYTGVSIITTIPAVAITFVIATAFKVAALFLAADIVQVDKNTFKTVKSCEVVANLLGDVGDSAQGLGKDMQDSGDKLKNMGKNLQTSTPTKGFFNNVKATFLNVIGKGTEKLGNVVKSGGEVVENGGKLVEQGSDVVKNEGVLATIHSNLSIPKENLKDTTEETVLLNASKGTYVIRPLVRGLIGCGRYLQKLRFAS